MNLLKISSRSIFRNKKRSMLTISMIFLGISFSILGVGWFNGASKNLEGEAVKTSGHIRVTAKDYELKEKTFDVSSNIEYEKVKQVFSQNKKVDKAVGRIKFAGLMFKNEEVQKEAIGYGIEKDDYNLMGFKEILYDGRFLGANGSKEIIVGEKLKNYLGINMGDEVTILSRTQDSSMTAMNYKVVGFYRFDNGKLNQSFFVTLGDAQELLDMDGAVGEYLVFLKNEKVSKQMAKELSGIYKESYLVKQWETIGLNGTISSILPVIKIIVVLIFGALGGVGVANTMLMVVFERRHEIGVMKAIGVENREIFAMLSLEGTILGIAGALLGAAAGGTIVGILSITGVNLGKSVSGMPAGITIKSIIYPGIDVLTISYAVAAGVIICFLATLLPIYGIVKKEPAEIVRE